MLSPFVLDRLARLNLHAADTQRSARLAERASQPRTPPSAGSRLPAGNEVENDLGRHWLVQAPLGQLWSDADRWLARERPQVASRHAELTALADHFPQSVLYLDLETCGFAGSSVFLIGVLHRDERELLVSQFLARDYAEEPAILRSFWQLAARNQVLVSFNGKSFDWPMVQDRSVLHRLQHSPPRAWVHCDLLHHARRRWKACLPNCRLQTLERFLCGRQRRGDIPGQDIPQAYHEFVRSGDPRQIRDVLQHNALDLVTLVQLSVALLSEGDQHVAPSRRAAC
jgi:uncharacterized protein YprB with RNaseH-like and TPR domain